MRTDYEHSFATLSERVDIVGEPRPLVTRPPRHDDDDLGPSIFRMRVEGVSLEHLTLPGLYVGRCELLACSFRGSDLQFAAFSWSDLRDCDFSGAGLAGAELRACHFVRCSFRNADLSRADLRGSTFIDCAFDEAIMTDTRLFRRSRLFGFVKLGPDQSGLPLSQDQRTQVQWVPDAPAPGGGIAR